MSARRSSFTCPVCSEEVPAGALACPECGACEKSGWSEDTALDGLDLPDAEFDYERYAEEEFGGGAKAPASRRGWALVALLLFLALFALCLLER